MSDTPTSDWVEASRAETRRAVAALPPDLADAARRSGTASTTGTQPRTTAGLLDLKTLVRTEYRTHGYLDPWLREVDVHQITDLVQVRPTDETIHRESGYDGVSHDDEVWVDTRGSGRRFQRMPNLIDYHGGTSWMLLGAEDNRHYQEPKPSTPYVYEGEPVTPAEIVGLANDLPHPEDPTLHDGPTPSDVILMALLQAGGADIHDLRPNRGTLAFAVPGEGLAALDLTPWEASHLDRLWRDSPRTRDLIAAVNGPGIQHWAPNPDGGGTWRPGIAMTAHGGQVFDTPESQIAFFKGQALDKRWLDLRVAR